MHNWRHNITLKVYTMYWPVHIVHERFDPCSSLVGLCWSLYEVIIVWNDITIATSRDFPAELGKHPSNVLPVVKIFDMAAGWLSGGSFDEIYGHCYLTVIKAVFNINIQSTLSVISLWLSRALLPWVPPFSCRVFNSRDVFRALLESPEKMQLMILDCTSWSLFEMIWHLWYL